MSKVYTKRGDSGMTTMRGGVKVDKADCHSEAIGDLDELNSYIGLCISEIERINIQGVQLNTELEYLTKVQNYLYNIGCIYADVKNKDSNEIVFDVNGEITKNMEMRIDALTISLLPLRHFIAPRGTEASCRLHVARTICRRTERHMKDLINKTNNIYIKNNCSAFMNRLSDYIFTLARYINKLCYIPEIIMVNN